MTTPKLANAYDNTELLDLDELGHDHEDDDTNTTEDTVLFQMTIRDFLIQFINEYFQEENTPDMSTDLLHERLRKFFKQEGTAGGDNPDGWVSFIQANDPKEERPVKKFTLKGKKKGKWYKKKNKRYYIRKLIKSY